MKRLTPEQVQIIVAKFKLMGDLSFFEDEYPEIIQEGFDEGFQLLTDLDLDRIGYHHADILIDNYGLDIDDMEVLDIISKITGFDLDFSEEWKWYIPN